MMAQLDPEQREQVRAIFKEEMDRRGPPVVPVPNLPKFDELPIAGEI